MENQQLFIGNLSYDATEADIRVLLSAYGTVMEIKVFKNKGYAFATVIDAADAQSIIDNLDKKEFKGRDLNISMRVSKTKAKALTVKQYEKKGEEFHKRHQKPVTKKKRTESPDDSREIHDDSQRHFLKVNSEKIYRDPAENAFSRKERRFTKGSRDISKTGGSSDGRRFSGKTRTERTPYRTNSAENNSGREDYSSRGERRFSKTAGENGSSRNFLRDGGERPQTKTGHFSQKRGAAHTSRRRDFNEDSHIKGDSQSHYLKSNSDKIYRDPSESPLHQKTTRRPGAKKYPRGFSAQKGSSSDSFRAKKSESNTSSRRPKKSPVERRNRKFSNGMNDE